MSGTEQGGLEILSGGKKEETGGQGGGGAAFMSSLKTKSLYTGKGKWERRGKGEEIISWKSSF